jgi:hypothetical protein
MPRRSVCLGAALATLVLVGWSAGAAELAGFRVPDRLRVGARDLVLNGIGVRSASRFGLTARVYVAALYLEKPSQDAVQVLDSGGVKAIKMKYLYAISAADMKRGWEHSFSESCPEKRCEPFQAQIAEFQALVGAVADGDLIDYAFFDDRVEISRPVGPTASVRGHEFSRLLLSTWIGKAPPTEELKRSLLGSRG